MYYLNEIEFLKLRDLLAESYSYPIDDNLRGWNWNKEPLRVPYSDIYLSAWEFSSPCPSYRDVYLRRKLNLRLPVSKDQILGFLVHKLVQRIFSYFKRLILIEERIENLESLTVRKKLYLEAKNLVSSQINQGSLNSEQNYAERLQEFLKRIVDYEHVKIVSRVREILAENPYIGSESLTFRAIPVNPELTVDGSLLGFSKNLRVDAFGAYGNIVYDIKLGRPHPRHKLQVTVYALALEASYMIPVNVGVLVYVTPDKAMEHFTVKREVFVIGDYLRSKVIEIRDELMKSLKTDKPPEKPSSCPKDCLLKSYCESV